ncbi:MAG: hypothetical protein ACXABY_11535 [Candidatus Thorarchaeota archaeon]|jgi:hypothetical protein
MPNDSHPQHGIVGKFHVDTKTSRDDKRHTQVLLKLPGFFYVCEDCTLVIDSAVENPPRNLEELVENLKENPWMEFIQLEKSGEVKIPEGQFKEKLRAANPDARFKTKKSPMAELKYEVST